MEDKFRTASTRSPAIIVAGALILSIIVGTAQMYTAGSADWMWHDPWHYDGTWSDGHVAGWGLWGTILFGFLGQ